MPKDLIPAPLQQPSWDEEHCEDSLKGVYDHVVKDAQDAIDWYMQARKPKKRGGLIVRGLAVVLIAAAGLLPLIAALAKAGKDNPPASVPWPLDPLAASLAVGLAAALVAFDKFFGFSSAWMRFMTAELTLRSTLEEFEIDWYALRAVLRGQKPTAEQVVQMLNQCKDFAAKINTIVTQETNAWVEEFKSSLSQVDQAVKAAETEAKTRADAAATAAKAEADAAATAAKARADAAKPGALNLEIVNIDKVTLPWTLWVDGSKKDEYTGATAAVAHLSPGQHTVRVFAIVDGKQRSAEKVFDVAANTLAEAKITV
jgi:SMODS and SLOG-associating 2TM effector domain 2